MHDDDSTRRLARLQEEVHSLRVALADVQKRSIDTESVARKARESSAALEGEFVKLADRNDQWAQKLVDADKKLSAELEALRLAYAECNKQLAVMQRDTSRIQTVELKVDGHGVVLAGIASSAKTVKWAVGVIPIAIAVATWALQHLTVAGAHP